MGFRDKEKGGMWDQKVKVREEGIDVAYFLTFADLAVPIWMGNC
jgi:hypothetical protein